MALAQSRNQHEAEAAMEMADSFGGDTLEKEFAGLETTATSTEVQDKLAALKKKIAG